MIDPINSLREVIDIIQDRGGSHFLCYDSRCSRCREIVSEEFAELGYVDDLENHIDGCVAKRFVEWYMAIYVTFGLRAEFFP